MKESTYRLTPFFYLNVVIILTCSIINGYNFSIDAVTSVLVAEKEKINPNEFQIPSKSLGWATSVHTLGSLLATVVLFKVAPKMSRRLLLLLSILASLVGSFFLGFSKECSTFYWGRFICGFGTGISCLTVPTFLSEISPGNLKTKVCSVYPFGSVGGTFMAQCAGLVFNKKENWQWFFFFPGILSFLYLPLLLLCFESPVYCELRGMFVKGRRIKKRLYREIILEKESREYPFYKKKSVSISTKPFIFEDIEEQLLEEESSAEEGELEEKTQEEYESTRKSILTSGKNLGTTKKTFLQAFFGKEGRLGVLIGTVLHISQQFSGINVLFCFLQKMTTKERFKDLNEEAKNSQVAEWTGIGLNVTYPLGLLIYFLVGSSFSKKSCLLFSMCFTAFFLLLFVLFFWLQIGYGVYLNVLLISVAYGLGFAAIPWSFLPDLFEKEHLFTFSIYFTFVNLLSLFILLFFTQFFLELFGVVPVFFFFFLVVTGSAILISLKYKKRHSETVMFEEEDETRSNPEEL